MTSKTTLALKLYYGATEKHIKAFWSMKERDMGIEGKMFGTTECRLMCEMGIPAYRENLTTWEKVLDYLRPLGDKMYRIHKQRKFYGRIYTTGAKKIAETKIVKCIGKMYGNKI